MNLLIDIGNSCIKWACYGKTLERGAAVPLVLPLAETLAPAWNGLPAPQGVFVSSVAGQAVADEIVNYCHKRWTLTPVFMTVTRDCKGLVNGYAETGQLGVDRWLALLAGWTRHKTSLCIVDCGSAVTLDIVLAGGQHLGGYIIPGAYLMQEMLIRHTSGIRAVPGGPSGTGPGDNTQACLRNGTHLAIAAFIDRVVADCESRHEDEFLCLITGGGAAAAVEFVSVPCIHEPDLVLQGIAIAAGIG
jgi:type III pantothenate kinase